MKPEKKQEFIFLDNNIYSPDAQIGVFGERVRINKYDGNEVEFTVVKTGKKGFVVLSELFAENTEKNKQLIRDIKKNRKEVLGIMKKTEKAFSLIQKAKIKLTK